MRVMSVLIVEDDKEVAQNLQLYLSSHFSTVDVAYDGNVAFQAYLNQSYDVIISDIEIPYLNGIALFKKIRKLDPFIKLILFSAHTKDTYLLEMVTLKLDDYLMKPITSRKIDAMLSQLLNGAEQEQKILCAKNNVAYSYLSKTITCKEKTVSLTHFEIILIELFLENTAWKVTHEMISETLYPGELEVKGRIKNVIKRVRQKLLYLKIISLPYKGYQLVCSETLDG